MDVSYLEWLKKRRDEYCREHNITPEQWSRLFPAEAAKIAEIEAQVNRPKP